MEIKNKVVFITGGTSGIGLSTVKLLLENGAKVIIYSKSIPSTPEVKELKKNEKVLIIKGDITKEKEIKSAIKESIKKFDRIDILINNAAIAQKKLFMDTDERDWEELVNVNILGVLNVTKQMIPEMISRKSGLIINIASGAGIFGVGELSIYSLTKAAVINFSQSLSEEIHKEGIDVITIAPGSTDTRMFKQLFGTRQAFHTPEQVAQIILKAITKDILPDERLVVDVFHHVHRV